MQSEGELRGGRLRSTVRQPNGGVGGVEYIRRNRDFRVAFVISSLPLGLL